MRQTVSVERLVEFGNALLKLDDDTCPVPSMCTKEYKEGVCDMIEKVLRESDRYAGYMLLGDKTPEWGTNGPQSKECFMRKYFIKHK